MDLFTKYLVNNFLLICIAIVLIINSIRKIKTEKRISLYIISIVSFTLLISVLDILKDFTQYKIGSVFATTFLAALLYVLRPACTLFFIFLCGQKMKSYWTYLLFLPLAYDFVINLLPLFDGTRTLVFYFDYDLDGVLTWVEGSNLFLRYTPHIVSIIYLVFLVYRSIVLLKSKHIFDAISILVCSVVVTAAIVMETFFNEHNDVYLLPSSIAVTTVFYYLFLYERKNKLDALTQLFNRASYYDDFSKYKAEITAVIQFDMNGLKYLNDNFGHQEGDKGLVFIAKAILDNATAKMYPYRLGGDEFIILAINESEDKVLKFIEEFKTQIETSKYHCSMGYAFRNETSPKVEDMLKISEKRMYEDKREFYKTNKIERRQAN